ncbi:MAG: PIN domain nuclease [Acidobacteriota bacterium]
MILVDSSVWIDYFRGNESPQTDKLDLLFGTDQIVVGDLILTEVLQGFDVEREFQNALELFGTVPLVTIGGHLAAVEAARNFRKLRAKGCTVRKTIDTLIATRCILSNLELLHNDRDFLPFVEHLGLKSVI